MTRVRRDAGVVIVLMALAIFLAANHAHCQTPSPTPNVHPGTWQVQPGIYVPCNGIKPFQPFVNVGDGNSYYLGGDVNANIAHVNLYGTYIDAIYYNHTRAYYSAEGFITPMFPQLGPINFYPAPSTAAQLCVQYGGFGNTAQCPTATDAQYTSKFLLNDVWIQSLKFYQPSINIACNGIQPTAPPTLTPTPARTPTPTPTFTCPPTPAQSAGAFVDWVYEAKAEGWMSGCGPNLFCPGFQEETANGFVTRAQEAYYLLIQKHGLGYTPPPCTATTFTDVPCVH